LKDKINIKKGKKNLIERKKIKRWDFLKIKLFDIVIKSEPTKLKPFTPTPYLARV
jgi:hypothetical protein